MSGGTSQFEFVSLIDSVLTSEVDTNVSSKILLCDFIMAIWWVSNREVKCSSLVSRENIDEVIFLWETENVLFLTGTNSEIKYKKEYLQMTNGEMCECCGEKIKKFPWGRYSKYMFLCDSCAARMEKAWRIME